MGSEAEAPVGSLRATPSGINFLTSRQSGTNLFQAFYMLQFNEEIRKEAKNEESTTLASLGLA